MPSEIAQIVCPKNPEHVLAIKRWLPPKEREQIRSNDAGDVFEIDCPICGKQEWQAEVIADLRFKSSLHT